MNKIDEDELINFWYPELENCEIFGRWLNGSSKEIVFLLKKTDNFFTYEYWKFQESPFGKGWHKSMSVNAGIYQTLGIAISEIEKTIRWVKGNKIEKRKTATRRSTDSS